MKYYADISKQVVK